MSLTTVNSVNVRAADLDRFLQAITELAAAARERKEAWRWSAYEVRFGDVQTFHFGYDTPDFASLAALGTVQELWTRVLGEAEGADRFRRVNGYIESSRQAVSMDRPDLSYAPQLGTRAEYPFTLVTTLRVAPGHADSCEELLRKVAEAIPKVDANTQLITYQTLIGDLRQYWAVRPLRSLAELDSQLPVPQLLDQAFGAAEGGLLWRSGNEAVEQAERQLVAYREELSNPPAA